MDKSKFKHTMKITVRSSEIDWQGIVHNARYLFYFEDGRVLYFFDRGINLDLHSRDHHEKVVIARNEIDYVAPARFGDVLTLLTRVSFVRNTSFAFEGILETAKGVRIAENVSVHVYLDSKTDEPVRVPDYFRKKILEFEGENTLVTWPADLA